MRAKSSKQRCPALCIVTPFYQFIIIKKNSEETLKKTLFQHSYAHAEYAKAESLSTSTLNRVQLATILPGRTAHRCLL